MYRGRGFNIKYFLTNQEFHCLKPDLLKEDIVLNETTTNKHVPEIEHKNRVVEEHI